jgi:hypothetical protein
VDLDDVFKLVGQMRAPGRLPAREGVVVQVVGVGQMVDIAQKRAEIAAVTGDAGNRQPAEAHAVIGLGPADQLHPVRIAPDLVIRPRDLERGIDRLRSRIGEEHPVEPGGGEAGDPLRQHESGRMAHLEGRDIVHPRRLILDRPHDPRLIMAGIHAPEPGHGIQNLPAVGGGVVHAAGRDEQARIGLERPVGRKRHPIGLEIIGGQSDIGRVPVGAGQIGGRGLDGHAASLRIGGDDGTMMLQKTKCKGWCWRWTGGRMPSSVHVGRRLCRGRRAPAAIARLCEAPALPGSPCPHHRHAPMSGAGPAGFVLPLPPSSPRRRGSRLVSTGMDGWPGARAAVSAITAGPGRSAFFVGGANLDPGLRRDDGGEDVPGLAATALDINGAARGWSEG